MITTLEEYRKQSAKLFAEREQYITESMVQDTTMQKEYLFYRANKRTFLPDNQLNEEQLFEDIHFNKRLRILEDGTDSDVLMNITSGEGNMDFLKTLDTTPYIFCSFHFGPFMQIGPYLHHQGIDFSVLTEPGIAHHQLHNTATADELKVMHSNASDILINMIDTLRNNKSLFVFLDGGQGSTIDQEKKSYLPIDFLGQSFYVKKGIPSLSYIANVPIIPLISYRTEAGELKVFFGNPINPDRTKPREAYVKQMIQECFDTFSQYLIQYPEQFTLWHSLHKYMDLPEANKTQDELPKVGKCRFNALRYSFFKDPKANYLFDNQTKQCLAISEGVWNLLQKFPNEGIQVEWLTKSPNISMWQEFARKEILIAA
jgi:lauroyl/myristoyl acyltransferase